jgi:HK97 family phage portal protein
MSESKLIVIESPRKVKSRSVSLSKSLGDGGVDDFGVNLFSENSDHISAHKALNIETVYTCIRDKAETVGRLPINMYKKDADGAIERVESDRLHKIFTQQPNDFMTAQSFMEFMTASYELNGAFYAYYNYNDKGSLMEIIPFRNQRNVVPQMDQYGRVYYIYVTNDGQPNISFGMSDLMVITQFTLDGFTPVTPIQQNATLLNGTYESENTWNKLQAEGITSQFALKTDKTVNNEAAARLKKDWSNFRGVSGIGNIPVLEDGMDIRSLQLSPKDVELLASRQFSVNRICRIFRVPPERVGVAVTTSSMTLLDVDESYMRNGIEPIIMKYESAVNLKIKSLGSKSYIKVNRKAFYNGSPHRMVESVTSEFKMGGCTINEMRIDLGRDPVEGGDVFAIDTNNITLGKLTDVPALQARAQQQQQQQQQQQPVDEDKKDDK